jgi:penicillin-binding protein 1A
MRLSDLKISRSAVVLLFCGGAFCGILLGLFIGLTRDLPQIRSLESFSPSAVTRIISSDEVLLAEIFLEKRHPVALQKIPQQLKGALIATEDRKFYRHSGVDLKAVIRAIYKDIRAGEFVEGASTITQQLAKTLFLTPRKTIVRKIKEALLAFQLERRYTKDEILTFYLNQVYFGSGAYGVESAARLYFGKTVSDLTLSECALLAGIPKSPLRYSPLIHPDLSIKRRNIVLRQMHEVGLLSEADLNEARQQPLQLAPGRQEPAKAPYFIDTVKKELEEIVGADQLYKGGLKVYTSLSYSLQQAAESAVRDGLATLETRMRKKKILDPDPQAALICLDVATAAIVAMVGGRDFAESPYNRAAAALRQPGSAFKPIVYAYAVEKGFAQNKLLLDAPVTFRGASKEKDWSPQNFSKSYLGEITMRKALAVSENIPAVRLLEMLGPASVARFGHKLGITSNLRPDLTLALGSSEVTLLELTAAYAVFANQGRWVAPYGILEITDRRGRQLWRVKPHKRVAMSRAGAAIITDMLTAVVNEGTGRRAGALAQPLAGKTGTTDGYTDALFIGFSPALATGVWVGRDLNDTLGDRETGSRAALPIWIDFMGAALASKPLGYFDIPDDVVRVTIDPVSGLPVSEDTAGAVQALFRKETLPLLSQHASQHKMKSAVR